MFEYMTAQEAAEKWNVSLRWVQRLCKGNRIEGVMNINRVWLIPKNAEKPAAEISAESAPDVSEEKKDDAEESTGFDISDIHNDDGE